MSGPLYDQVAALLDELNDLCAQARISTRYFLEEGSIVESMSDISDLHQEVKGYAHCIEINFNEDLDDENEDLNEENRIVYQETAIKEWEIADPDVLCDWRDGSTLWLRFN
jgi:hypothetical protein